MAKYEVKIIETLVKNVIVESDSFDSSIDSVREMWDKEECVLTSEDFYNVEFYSRKVSL